MADAVKKRSRLKSGCFAVVIAFVAVIVIAIAGFNYWLDQSEYKPMIEAAISDALGMAATIDDLDIVLFPTPAVEANNIRIGTATFYATVDRATARGDLSGLSSKSIRITEVTLSEPVITFPKNLDEVDEWADKLGGESGGGGGGWDVAIDRIDIEGARVRQGAEDVWVDFDGEVMNPLDSAEFVVTGNVPMLGDTSVLEGGGTFTIKDGMKASASLSRIDTAALSEAIPHDANAKLNAKVSSDNWTVWQGDIDGAFAGNAVVAIAQFAKGVLTINNIQLQGDGLEVQADATRHPDGGIGLLISDAHVEPGRLEALVRDATDDALQLRDGALDVEGLYAGIDSEGAVLLSEGKVTLANATVSMDGKQIAAGARLDATVKDNAISIDTLKAEGIDLKGSVTPLPEWNGATIDLSGVATLSDGLIAPLDLGPGIHDLKGNLKVDRIACTIAGEGLPEDLVITGTLSDGAVTTDFGDSFAERFTGVKGDFTSDGKVVNVKLSGVGSSMGGFRATSNIDTSGQRLTGTLTGTASQLGAPAYWNDWARDTLQPVLATYGDVTFGWSIQLPTAQKKELFISAAIPNEGNRHLHGDIYMNQATDGTMSINIIEVNAGFPAAALNGMSEPMTMDGWAALAFTKPANANTFEVAVDLSKANLDLPPYVYLAANSAGSNLPRVRVTGGTEPWGANQLLIDLTPTVSATGVFRGKGVVFENVNVPLSQVAMYFPADTMVDGNISGRIVSSPLDVELQFADVRVAPSGGLDPIAVHGEMRIAENMWDIPGLDVQGANSQLRITGKQRGGVWKGTVTGPQLDVNAVQELVAQWTTTDDKEVPADADEGASTGTALSIEAEVDLDKVLYRRADSDRTLTVSNVMADVAYNDAGLNITNISATPYNGQLTGAVAYSNDAILDMNLHLQEVAARSLDDLFFVEPLGITGAITGDVALRMPIDEDPAAGMSGTIELSAVKGTLGEMGIATQILDLLRTIQIWNLLSGWNRENGLIYDTLSTKITANEGVMTIEQLRLKNNYLVIGANGTVDFARLTSDVPIAIEVLEGVFKPVQAVPVVGQTAGNVGVIEAKMTGSPYEPDVTPTNIRGFKNLGDQIRGAGNAIEEEVINRVIDGIGNLLRRRN